MSPTVTNICQYQRILKITPFSGEFMLPIFCNINGVMHLEFMSNGTNSTSMYCNNRLKKLKA